MKVTILGNGISGITCARHLRKLSNCNIEVISSESKHFFSRTALMYVYMGHMTFDHIKPYEDYFWEKNRIELTHDHVLSIDFHQKIISFASGRKSTYDKLVLALGSKSNMFGWPGQDLKRVGGLYHLQDLHEMEAYSPTIQRAVVVGGGLIGIEMAEMFRSRNKAVTMLVREDSYWNNVLPQEESVMISNHIRDHHIDLRLGVNLGEIHDDGSGQACAVTVKESGEQISCQYVGLTAGVSPNIGWLKGTTLETDRGILVDSHLETNIKGVYAVGDCVQLRQPTAGRRAIEAVWYTGRMMGETAAYNISGTAVSYDPGIWFNSAKFLDIEYQVYGDIPSTLPEGMDTIYWQHPSQNISIRINYDSSTSIVRGFNLMGVRFRHEVCEKWIKDKASLGVVIPNLSLALFDPEFYQSHIKQFQSKASSDLGKSYNGSAKSSWDIVRSFLHSPSK